MIKENILMIVQQLLNEISDDENIYEIITIPIMSDDTKLPFISEDELEEWEKEIQEHSTEISDSITAREANRCLQEAMSELGLSNNTIPSKILEVS